MQFLISVLGILIMFGMAWVISWYKRVRRQRARKKAPSATPTWRGGAMRTAILSLVLLAGASPRRWRAPGARLRTKPVCDVPAYLLTSDSALAKVAEAVKGGKPLNVLVVGSRSSTIPSLEASAWPAQLQATLKAKLGDAARQSLRRNTGFQDRRGDRRHAR